MKIAKKMLSGLFAVLLSLVMLYIDLIYSFPQEIKMLVDELHNASVGAGVYVSDLPRSVYTSKSQNGIIPSQSGEYEATLKIANAIPFRKVRLKVSPAESVNASGELVGMRIFNKGLIVTKIASVTDGNNTFSPAKDAGILPGDIILEINGSPVTKSEEVASLVKEKTTLTVQRNNSVKIFSLSPAASDDGTLKLGIWVRDSTAGVGTLTFYDKEKGVYGALGHPINDSDTGIMFNVSRGSLEKSSVVSIKKGVSGIPGEIRGSFSSEKSIVGTVEKNCESGIFGKFISEKDLSGISYPIGVMSQVKEGEATILSTVDDSVKEYKIKILRSMPFGSATKGLMIEVTDPELLSRTGGIVQGMSGSPIIQNGKLVGAVTHVFVNDPTRGYGIFIENMLAKAEKIK